MVYLPRIAIGTVQPGAHAQPMVWGLLEALRRIGVLAQSFLSKAQFPRYDGALNTTGFSPRHLDSWLMSPEVCRTLFVRGAGLADLAVVEGQFRQGSGGPALGGQLEPLCQWLDLPRLVVLDVARLEDCRPPEVPRDAAGLFLDGISDEGHFARLATNLESVFGIPVLGALDRASGFRVAMDQVPRGERVPPSLCRQLGERVARWWKPRDILRLATQREMPSPDPSWLARTCGRRRTLTVAIAYDEAFNCYFPDTLDLLELRGAAVVSFSPLHDEHLPPQSDVVCFGCGHPERYAAALSENHCMFAALRSHLCAGRRIYGEGGGAAYLCRQMETPAGDFRRMAGILPAIARLHRGPAAAEPVEVSLASPTWLGGVGSQLRGYHNPHWTMEPLDSSWLLPAEPSCRRDLIGDHQAIGSLIHLNFAADVDCLEHFFYPEFAARCSMGSIAAPFPL